MPENQLKFFYDEQIRRYLLQFTRIFTSFQYQTGKDANGNRNLRQIPAHYAHRDRMVAHILRNNSENVVLSAPFITTWIADIDINDNRRQNPSFVDRLNVDEREINESTGKYTEKQGNSYTVQRYMPVPYDLKMQVDIWTTNEQQKHQILEQILVLFNPSIDLQSSTNPVDWTSLTHVKLTDVTWSSRSLPIGTGEEIDVATLRFEVPIWINPPAKVQRQNIIQTIRTNINQVNKIDDNNDICHGGKGIPPTTAGDKGNSGQVIVRGHDIFIRGDKVTLLSKFGNEKDENGNVFSWQRKIFDNYGQIQPGLTELRLITSNDIDDVDSDIVGTLQEDPNNENQLIWSVNPLTLPKNTLESIDAIIDPHSVYPGKGLPNAEIGQRYLITKEIGGNTQAWGDLTAEAYDIIMKNSNGWFVSFDASENKNTEYVLNNHTGKQLMWNGEEWIFVIDGHYQEGEFRIFI